MSTAFSIGSGFASCLLVSALLVGGSESGRDSTKLPPSVNLFPTLERFGFEPRVQGKRGTCSVFVVTQSIEFALAKKDGKCERLSVEFLNWASNRAARNRQDGGFFSDLWTGFDAYGICSEESMPYQETFEPRARPSEQARQEAESRRAAGLRLHWIKEWDPNRGLSDAELEAVRKTLANGWPVCGGFLWPKSQVWKDGVLQICPREDVRDGHSVFLVGYRDDPAYPGGGVVLIRNTSGPSRQGLLTYEYLKAYMNDAIWVDFAVPDAPQPAAPSDP